MKAGAIASIMTGKRPVEQASQPQLHILVSDGKHWLQKNGGPFGDASMLARAQQPLPRPLQIIRGRCLQTFFEKLQRIFVRHLPMGREVEEATNLPFLSGTLVHLRGLCEVDFVSLSIYDNIAHLMAFSQSSHQRLVRTILAAAGEKACKVTNTRPLHSTTNCGNKHIPNVLITVKEARNETHSLLLP